MNAWFVWTYSHYIKGLSVKLNSNFKRCSQAFNGGHTLASEEGTKRRRRRVHSRTSTMPRHSIKHMISVNHNAMHVSGTSSLNAADTECRSCVQHRTLE